MPFPWGQSCLPASFTCPYCGEIKHANSSDQVVVCGCPASEQAAVEDRQRAASFQQTQDNAYRARLAEANRRRRERSSSK